MLECGFPARAHNGALDRKATMFVLHVPLALCNMQMASTVTLGGEQLCASASS